MRGRYCGVSEWVIPRRDASQRSRWVRIRHAGHSSRSICDVRGRDGNVGRSECGGEVCRFGPPEKRVGRLRDHSYPARRTGHRFPIRTCSRHDPVDWGRSAGGSTRSIESSDHMHDCRTEHGESMLTAAPESRCDVAGGHGHSTATRAMVCLTHHRQLQLVVAKPNRDVVHDRGREWIQR